MQFSSRKHSFVVANSIHSQLETEPKSLFQPLNRESFEALFRAEFKGLCFFAQRYVKDYETARELVQEAFVGLWEKRAVIDTSRPYKSYLSTAIHNKCQNYLRDNRKFSTDLLQIENLLELSDPDSFDHIVKEELSAAIEAAIAELPEKCREIFLLSRFENLKYHEIAEKLDLSQKTVEAQMSKALQHMRLRLSAYIPLLLIWLTFLNGRDGGMN